MLGAAIVPESDRSLVPVIANGETGAGDPANQILQEHLALIVAELDDATREVLVHEERLPAGLRMNTHHGMNRLDLGLAVWARIVERRQPLAEIPDRRRERFIGPVHIGPQCVASDRWALPHL
jgi:hypothetical protein